MAKPFSVGQLVGTLRSVLADRADSVEWNAEGRHLMPWIESLLQAGYPSTIVVYNTGSAAVDVQLGIFDARTGTRLGTYTTGQIAANTAGHLTD